MAGAGVNKRVGAVLLAVVFAAVATLALLSYMRGLEQEAFAEAEPVEAYVAKDTIPAGTSAEVAIGQGLISRTAVPRKAVAEGAITSLDQIEGSVATVNIVKGEQILSSRFGAAAETTTDLAPIPEGHQAMAIDVALVPGVAGRVEGGDRVSILAGIDGAGGDGADAFQTRFLLQNVEVLAIGQRVVTTDQQGGAATSVQYPADRVIATVAVTPPDAEKLAYAVFKGQLYLTLVPEDQEPAATAGRTLSNLFN